MLQILFATTIVTVAYIRWLFLRASTNESVDHYYWILAATAYREQRGFPVRIPDKFLLEDERQFYPPGFGILLALFSDTFLRSSRSVMIVIGIDMATLAVLISFALAIGLSMTSIVVLITVYGLAPVLVAYNTQLTSRGLGNLFLVVKLLAEVAAVSTMGAAAAVLWLIAIVATAAVIMTHKMTTQFMLILWPIWSFALGAGNLVWMAMLMPLFGGGLAALITGPAFHRMQWLTHWDIVTFWNRNWPQLGAHQFRQSPIYGDVDGLSPIAFHQSGMKGVVSHATFIIGYVPAALVLPLTLVFAPEPPLWLMTWLAAAILISVMTLYVPFLKCLGGGHLYLFNSVAPAALWWGMLFAQPTSTIFVAFTLAMLATGGSLFLGWRKRNARILDRQDALTALIARLNTCPAGRVASYPATACERIALETSHAVLWGGHGLGFRDLEPHWPVVRMPLREAFNAYDITYAALDTSWWPEGEDVLAQASGDFNPERFKGWRFYKLGNTCPVSSPANSK